MITKVQLNKMQGFIADNIGEFHDSVLKALQERPLDKYLRLFNPYLHKAKFRESAHDFVKTLVDDFLRQSERTKFGGFLEEFALFVGANLYGGRKSMVKGVDLEFTRGKAHYAVSIKSSPNWGNDSQVRQQRELFISASRVAAQTGRGNRVVFVLGSCYGRRGNIQQGTHERYCGQDFWRFLSEDDSLYLQIVEPLGHQAKRHNDDFTVAYNRMLNRMTQEFINRFCNDNGEIQWEEVVKFNSAKKKPKPPAAPKPPRKRKQVRKQVRKQARKKG